MRVALIGTHGTGKTTVFEKLRERRPEAAYFIEAVRHQMGAFGLGHPVHDACKTYGIGAFELFNMNSWSVMDPAVNSILDPDRLVITDRSTVDSYGYFLAMRDRPADDHAAPLVLAIARYYAGMIDQFVRFPVGAFALQGDEMRPDDAEFQLRVDACITLAFEALGVPANKIHTLAATGVEDRVEEIISLLPAR